MLWKLWSLAGCAAGARPTPGLPQTSLSCQLTHFPRVPQCQRPSESVSANTRGGEAGKMFTFVPDSQTRAAKQRFIGYEHCVRVLISNRPRSQSWGFFFFLVCVHLWSRFELSNLSVSRVRHLSVCKQALFFGWDPPTAGAFPQKLTQLEQESLKTLWEYLPSPPRSRAYRALTPYFAEMSRCGSLMRGRVESRIENILPQGSASAGRSHWNRLLIIVSVVCYLIYGNLSCIFVRWSSLIPPPPKF